MYRNCKKTSRASEEEQLQMLPENKITGTGRNRESVLFDWGRGGTSL